MVFDGSFVEVWLDEGESLLPPPQALRKIDRHADKKNVFN
jgi:hypothetical protein